MCVCICVGASVFCLRWLMSLTITSAPECYGHLSSHAGSSRTLPLNAGRIYKPPWAPSRALSCLSHTLSLPLSLRHTHTHTNSWRAKVGKREKWILSFLSFNWGCAVVSVPEPLRGGHQTKEKPFTFIVFYHRELKSLFSLCLSSFFHTSHIFPPIHLLFPFSPALWTTSSISIFYKTWRFDNALWVCQLVENTERAKREKRGRRRETAE